MEELLSIIKIFNDDYSTATLCLVSIFTLLYVLKEHNINKRPKVFVTPKDISTNEGGYNFFASIKNVGNYPAKVLAKKIGIKIGDNESVETEQNRTFTIPPGEKGLSVSFGHINGNDVENIANENFEDNRCIIFIELESGYFTDSKLDYHSNFSFEVVFERGRAEYKALEHDIT